VLPLTTQKEALVQQTVAYFLTGIVHGPIQIVPASVPAASHAAVMPVCCLASLGVLRCLRAKPPAADRLSCKVTMVPSQMLL